MQKVKIENSENYVVTKYPFLNQCLSVSNASQWCSVSNNRLNFALARLYDITVFAYVYTLLLSFIFLHTRHCHRSHRVLEGEEIERNETPVAPLIIRTCFTCGLLQWGKWRGLCSAEVSVENSKEGFTLSNHLSSKTSAIFRCVSTLAKKTHFFRSLCVCLGYICIATANLHSCRVGVSAFPFGHLAKDEISYVVCHLNSSLSSKIFMIM